MSERKAIVLGATGLIGKQLIELLLNDTSYNEVLIFVRKTTSINHDKLTEHIIDFDQPENWGKLIKGDVLFSAFGTTIKKAGSKENQYKIDVSYQFEIARAAAENNVPKYILISSTGANSKSKVFYNHIKGRLEDKISELNFAETIIFRPSVLVGDRPEKRKGEIYGAKLIRSLSFIPFIQRYRPIEGKIVAKAMIHYDLNPNAKKEYILNEIFEIGD